MTTASFLQTKTTEAIIDRLNVFKQCSMIRFGSNTCETFYVYKTSDNVVWSISSQSLSMLGCIYATYPMSNLSSDAEIEALASTLNLQ
jgi:hypothetical protein